jgi:hypothetical protein
VFKLKRISQSAVPAALEKAERYRLLNEPADAESICRDVLDVSPENQDAMIHLVLALTDQFSEWESDRFSEAKDAAARLHSGYDRAYYSGIVHERWAKAQYQRGMPRCGVIAYEGLRKAMGFYEQAEALQPPGKDDALLRWNTCARMIMGHSDMHQEERVESVTELE